MEQFVDGCYSQRRFWNEQEVLLELIDILLKDAATDRQAKERQDGVGQVLARHDPELEQEYRQMLLSSTEYAAKYEKLQEELKRRQIGKGRKE